MGGPHFPQHIESYSGFVYPNLDIFIGTSVNADYTAQVDKRGYFLQDGIPHFNWSVVGAVDLHNLGLTHIRIK